MEGAATQICNLLAVRHGHLQHRVAIVIVFETFPRKRVSHGRMVGDIEMPHGRMQAGVAWELAVRRPVRASCPWPRTALSRGRRFCRSAQALIAQWLAVVGAGGRGSECGRGE